MGLTLSSFKLNWKPTKSRICLRSNSNFLSLPFKLTPDTELLETVCAGDRFGGNWLGSTSHTGGLWYFVMPPLREDSHSTVN